MAGWTCKQCNTSNWASKKSCRQCGKKKHQGSVSAGKWNYQEAVSDKKKELSARIKTLQGHKQQFEGVEGLEDVALRPDQDVEETKRQIIESKFKEDDVEEQDSS